MRGPYLPRTQEKNFLGNSLRLKGSSRRLPPECSDGKERVWLGVCRTAIAWLSPAQPVRLIRYCFIKCMDPCVTSFLRMTKAIWIPTSLCSFLFTSKLRNRLALDDKFLIRNFCRARTQTEPKASVVLESASERVVRGFEGDPTLLCFGRNQKGLVPRPTQS